MKAIMSETDWFFVRKGGKNPCELTYWDVPLNHFLLRVQENQSALGDPRLMTWRCPSEQVMPAIPGHSHPLRLLHHLRYPRPHYLLIHIRFGIFKKKKLYVHSY